MQEDTKKWLTMYLAGAGNTGMEKPAYAAKNRAAAVRAARGSKHYARPGFCSSKQSHDNANKELIKTVRENQQLPGLMMDESQVEHLNHVLNSLDASDDDNEAAEATGLSNSLRCQSGSTSAGGIDYLNEPQQGPSTTSRTGQTFTRTIDGMRDTAFKRAYMDNVMANQFSTEGQPEVKRRYAKVGNDSSLDEWLRRDLFKLQRSYRYQNMLESRTRLPSYKMQGEILQLVKDNQVLVLSGETGCGKTTQVPQFVLENEILSGRGSTCNIVCTQPRRISAITVAHRVADERGESLGQSVGYQIRLEAKRPRKAGSIMYCTTGIVLQWLQGDQMLRNVSHLVLDEIHERDTLSDFLITITRDLLPKRPDLKVILMSATLNAETFSQYYGGCAIIKIPGFTFPVAEYYLEDVIEMTRFKFDSLKQFPRTKKSIAFFADSVLPWLINQQLTGKMSQMVSEELAKPSSERLCSELVVALIKYICHQPPGAVLVFLPGWFDIRQVHNLLQEDHSISRDTLVIPLHSLMPTANQREVFNRPPAGKRKIVLATNIAETSITIDDIVYVIDTGYMKMKNFDKDSSMETLEDEWVTRANAHQRKGRAGRVQEGICYHLYTRIRESQLEEYPLPEIMRTRLEEIILHVKILKLGKVKSFLSKLMQPPEERVVDISTKLLESVRALDEDENLTPLGFHLAKMPVDPLTGRMLMMAAIFSCVDPILTIAATLAFKDPFVTPLGKESSVDVIKAEMAGATCSDHLMYVKLYDAWQTAVSEGDHDFCSQNFLAPTSLEQLKTMRTQFFGMLKEHQFIGKHVKDSNCLSVNKYSGNIAVVRAVLTSGLYPNVARVIRAERHNPNLPINLRTSDGRNVSLHHKCVNEKLRDFDTPWMVYRKKMKTFSINLFDASCVSNYPLLLFGQNLNYNPSDGWIDVDGFVRIKCSQNVADVIRKLRRELDHLLEYKISHPSVTEWDPNTREGKVLETTVSLLTNEVMDYTWGEPQQKYNDRYNNYNWDTRNNM